MGYSVGMSDIEANGGLWGWICRHKFRVDGDSVDELSIVGNQVRRSWDRVKGEATFEALRRHNAAHEALEKGVKQPIVRREYVQLLHEVNRTNDDLPKNMQIEHRLPYNFNNDMAEIRAEVVGEI